MAQRTIYKWTINNLSKTVSRDDPNLVLNSKRFTLSGSNFKFYIQFKPKNTDETEYCALYLNSSDLDEMKSVELSYKFWIENADGDQISKEISKVYTRVFDTIGKGRGFPKFVHHDKLYPPASTFIKHDILFTCCEILFRSSIPSDGTPQLTTKIGKKEWSLYQEGFTGLCIIKVSDQKFERLMAHSIVFDRMLKSGTKEEKAGTITLKETTPSIVQSFFKYLHVHEVENSDEEALELYFLAHKYEIVDLKKKCSQILVGKLDEHNILDRLITAFRFKDIAFKRGVLDYLADRPGPFTKIMKSDEWPKFIADNMLLSREIVDEAFKSMNWY